MKSQFSTSWKRSKQPRKQRKYIHNAPLHILHKLLSAQLSKELREKHGIRNIPVRKGDVVRVVVGSLKGKEGKVERVSQKHIRVFVSGMQAIRSDGRKVNTPIHPSNLVIKELDLNDKKRKAILERKKQAKTRTTKEKPKTKEPEEKKAKENIGNTQASISEHKGLKPL
ncbi:MAG: 50S ribosomal protein L24 [Nanoarchaeota archaeon]|nr:50S ribosomal protein L24 [Nanoarchaeota archaeon]